MPEAFRRKVRRGYLAPSVAMAVFAAAMLWWFSVQLTNMSWVGHTYQVIWQLKDAQLDLRDMELAAGDYLRSLDRKHLAEFANANSDLSAKLTEILVFVSDDPIQGERLLKVSDFKGNWTRAINTLMIQAGSGNRAAAGELDQLDGEIRAAASILSVMSAWEERLLKERRSQVKTGSWLIFILVPFLAGTVALLLGYSGWREIGRASQRFATALTEAEEANKAKDNFIAVLSHELRNPLNAIILLAAILLSKREIDEDVRERISAIDRAARTQARLIEDLLDVSRIGNGGLRLDMQAIDLVQVVKSTIDSMRVAAEAKSLTIENIIDPDIPITAGDPRRLAQAVENLLSNAVKFTSKGGMVQVRLQRVNSHLEIAIIDNGRGIAPSSIAHIFDRFWQGKDAGQHGSGAGLGLAIVKEVVMLHGGTVTAHSEGLGRGSTFTVRLPVPPVIAGFSEPVQHPAVAPVKNAGLAPRLDGYFILVVDDDPKACEALATLLNSVGARVRAENSVEEALKALDGRVPDVIITDIEMPIYDGFHLARQIRQREENMAAGQRIPIIALTAHGGVEDRIGILNSGFDIHLVKPVDVTELSAAIRSLVPAKAA